MQLLEWLEPVCFVFFFKKKDVEIVNMLTALRIEHRFEIQERGQMLK